MRPAIDRDRGDIPRGLEAAAQHAIELVGDLLFEIVEGHPQQLLAPQAELLHIAQTPDRRDVGLVGSFWSACWSYALTA